MLDLRDLNQVSLGDGVLSLMPKATNYAVNQALSHVDFVLPGGDCPTVAMGGQLSGGGFGYVGKHYGLGRSGCSASTGGVSERDESEE